MGQDPKITSKFIIEIESFLNLSEDEIRDVLKVNDSFVVCDIKVTKLKNSLNPSLKGFTPILNELKTLDELINHIKEYRETLPNMKKWQLMEDNRLVINEESVDKFIDLLDKIPLSCDEYIDRNQYVRCVEQDMTVSDTNRFTIHIYPKGLYS